jgi:hypothetical protein
MLQFCAAVDKKMLHVCDREEGNYKLFDRAIQRGRYFLIWIAKNRMTIENGLILDKIRRTEPVVKTG